MSRKAEILQAEETAPNSPLRRSSRRTALTSSPAPARLGSRRSSQSQTEAIETKTIKTRRASLSQDNTEKNEITENKPAPRGRRASTAKEADEKTEPAKTRSRRTSASSEPPAEEAEKKQIVTRGRKSAASEEQVEAETAKPVRSRRSSVTNTPVKEETVRKPVTRRRSSAKEEETKEEPPKKILRSRRGSAAEEIPETEQKKPATRGRKSSTDKLHDEPDTSAVKLTPVKSKRRPSVTENAINLEPIEEQEQETKVKTSTSPPKPDLKASVASLPDVKSNREAKTNLDLSTIKESSFTDESLTEKTTEKKVVTPRKSPRLNKETKSSTMDTETIEKQKSPQQSEVTNMEAFIGKSPKNIKETKENIKEIKSDAANISLEKGGSSSPRKKLHFPSETSKDINTVELVEAKETVTKEEDSVQTGSLIQDNKSMEAFIGKSPKNIKETKENIKEIKSDAANVSLENTVELVEAKEAVTKEEDTVQTESLIQDKSDSNTESIEQSVLEAECEEEKEYNEQKLLEDPKTSSQDSNLESDQSFKFKLDAKAENPDDNVEDDLNTSKNSSSSDKENIELNTTKDPTASRVDIADKIIKSIVESNHQTPNKDVHTIARVSNVFRPRNKENSFLEPMDIDESIFNITQDKKLQGLEEFDIKKAPPAESTPILRRSVGKIQNEDHNKSKEDMEEIVSRKDQSIEVNKSNEASVNMSEVITVHSEVTLDESKAIFISNQEATKDQVSEAPSEDTTDNVPKSEIDTSTPENISNLKTSGQERDLCESPLSEEEIGKEHSDKLQDEVIEVVETEESLEKSQQLGQVDDELECKSPQEMTSDEMLQSLESEALDETNSSIKSETVNVDGLKCDAGDSLGSASHDLIKTLVIELKNKPILMKSLSPQPDHPMDDLKPQASRASLGESISPRNASENPEEEQSGEKSAVDRQETEMNENKENGAKGPQTIVGEIKPEDKDVILQVDKTDVPKPEKEMENLDVELNQDKVFTRETKSPHPELEVISKATERSEAMETLDMPELADATKETLESPRKLKDLESEPEDYLQGSPKSDEFGKTDVSVDYEFEIPSDEEDGDKTHNLELKANIKSDFQPVLEKASEFGDSIVEKSPSSKRRPSDTVLNQNKKIRLSLDGEETAHDDSTYAANCEVNSPDELPITDSLLNTEAGTDEAANKTDMREEGDKSTTEPLKEKDDLSNSQNTLETNLNKMDDKTYIVTEPEIIKDKFPYQKGLKEDGNISAVNTDENVKSDLTFEKEVELLQNSSKAEEDEDKNTSKTFEYPELDINKEVSNQEETRRDNVSIRNKEEDVTVSVVNVEENLTSEESDAQMDVTEMEKSVQTSSDAKQNKKDKTNPKRIKPTSVETTQIDEDIKSSSSNDAEANSINKENDNVVESDFQDVIQDSSDIDEKNRKIKSKKQKRITKQNKNTMWKEEESQLEDVSIVESRSTPGKKSKKLRVKNKNPNEDNYNDNEVEKTKSVKKSKKNPDVYESKIKSSKNEKSRKSVGETSDEEFSSDTKKEKKFKKRKRSVEDVVYLESENNKNLNRKSRKNTADSDLNQDGSPRTQALVDLNPSAMSKFNKYLADEILKMQNQDESHESSAEEEEEDENSEEENEFISTMAEEGEEDTPSEGSNDIIDEGESINSTDTEVDSDESYDVFDPFICDDEDVELLSGEEYDLGSEKKKKRSRIIPLDDCDDEIIKIKRKEKPVKKNKRSRIIPQSDSSDSEVDNVIPLDESLEEIGGDEKTSNVKEETDDDDVIILEEQSTPLKYSNQIESEFINLTTNNVAESPPVMTKKKSIIIHENIDVAKLKNSDFGENISSMVHTFCNKIHGGEISMNLSLEHAVDNHAESSKYNNKMCKRFQSDLGERSEEEVNDSKTRKRLNSSLNDVEDSESKQSSRKKRRSASLDDLSASKSKKSKTRSVEGKKKKFKSQKCNGGSKTTNYQRELLHTKTFSLMDQLITDVKNRPVRTIRPSTTVINMNGSWISEVADMKPSTTLATKLDESRYKPGKVHPKDFRSQMLYDPSRIRRVDTKTLLRKRGAYF